MMKEILNTDFGKFMDSRGGRLGEGYRLIQYWGLYQGDYFYNWFSDLLEKYTKKKDLTFNDVYKMYGHELVVTATDLTKRKLVYYNHLDNPNMEIRDAVRRSMSIPVFFVPILVKDGDGLIHVYVDGGCTNNFPLNYFDKYYSTAYDAFDKTLGFNLTENDNNDKDPKLYTDRTTHIGNVIDLVQTLVNTDVEVIERLRLTDYDKYRVVTINTYDMDATNFNMNREDINKLIESGYKATKAFFGEHVNSTVQ